MKNISLLFGLSIVGLLLVVESSQASNEINLETLSHANIVYATPSSLGPTVRIPS